MSLQHISQSLAPTVVRIDQAAAQRQGKTVIQTIADAGGWAAPEEGSERYRALSKALDMRGTPWQSGGSGPQFDGWTLARECAAHATQRDCIDLPRLGGLAIESDARAALTQWGLSEVRLRHAAPGDFLLIHMEGGFHIAILSAAGGELSWAMNPGATSPEAKIIHAQPCRAVSESFVGPFWMDRLVGAFSFDTPGAPLRAVQKAAA